MGEEVAGSLASALPTAAASELSAVLKVLAVENRLHLLAMLREPRTIDEIMLRPGAAQAGERPERPISRVAIREHLEQLRAAGFVRVRMTQRDGRRKVQEFVVDHARLFAVGEDVRTLGLMQSQVALEPEGTMPTASGQVRTLEPGPKLVLVHGVREGRAFALRPAELTGTRGWVVGRHAEAHVRLEYDPYVSSQNAEITWGPAGYLLADLPAARNGTWLNFRRLAPGATAPLESGDIVGVGRSLLVFREH